MLMMFMIAALSYDFSNIRSLVLIAIIGIIYTFLYFCNNIPKGNDLNFAVFLSFCIPSAGLAYVGSLKKCIYFYIIQSVTFIYSLYFQGKIIFNIILIVFISQMVITVTEYKKINKDD